MATTWRDTKVSGNKIKSLDYNDLRNYLINHAAEHEAGGEQELTQLHSHANKIILDAIQEAFTTTLKNKLDGIEDAATIDQTAGEIRDLLAGLTGADRLAFDALKETATYKYFTATLLTKLNGIAEDANNYSLPTATDLVKGGIKIGDRLSIVGEVLSAIVQSDNNLTNALKTAYDDAVTKAHTQNTDEYLATQVTQTLYVDGNRSDSYTENGSITKPYKTIQAAITAAESPGSTMLIVAPGTYTGNINLGSKVVGLIGSGVNATVLTGNLTIADRAHTLRNLQITSAGSLIITNNLTASHLWLQCAVTVSDNASFEGWSVIIQRASGVALTINSTGLCSINAGYIVTVAANAVYQTTGSLIIRNSIILNNSFANPAINSIGGVCVLIQVNIANQGAGVAASLNNGGAAASANQVSDVTASGNISCGTATTYVEALNFVVFGELSGSVLIYRPASRLKNDSAVTGDTVKDALDNLWKTPTVPITFQIGWAAGDTYNQHFQIRIGTGNGAEGGSYIIDKESKDNQADWIHFSPDTVIQIPAGGIDHLHHGYRAQYTVGEDVLAKGITYNIWKRVWDVTAGVYGDWDWLGSIIK